LLVTNSSGAALLAGDHFTLFSAPSFNGTFANSNLPPLNAGLVWNASRLATDGTLWVLSTAPPVITATISSGGSLTFAGGGGTPNWTYYVLATTNLALPKAQWPSSPPTSSMPPVIYFYQRAQTRACADLPDAARSITAINHAQTQRRRAATKKAAPSAILLIFLPSIFLSKSLPSMHLILAQGIRFGREVAASAAWLQSSLREPGVVLNHSPDECRNDQRTT